MDKKQTQLDKFKEAECDEYEKRWDERLKKNCQGRAEAGAASR